MVQSILARKKIDGELKFIGQIKMVNNVIRNFPANNKLLSKINLRRLSGS